MYHWTKILHFLRSTLTNQSIFTNQTINFKFKKNLILVKQIASS